MFLSIHYENIFHFIVFFMKKKGKEMYLPFELPKGFPNCSLWKKENRKAFCNHFSAVTLHCLRPKMLLFVIQ